MTARVSPFWVPTIVLALLATTGTADEPKPLAEGRTGIVVGTTGRTAVEAGLAALKKGGTAADAAMTTALTQVVECGGCYVSAAGILSMTYYDAATGKVHYLNACYNTPRGELDPQSIPASGKPSGRSALVPGFMAGVDAAHERFGKLPRKDVFAPAITLAETGFKIEPMLAGFIQSRTDVLGRLPETKRIFTKDDGTFLAQGDLLKQPQLAATLREVAEHGAGYLYTGEWGKRFVAAVQKEGGKITQKDLDAYKVVWEEPIRAKFREYEVAVPGFTSVGGVNMAEALHLLELADLRAKGRHTQSPESLFWLMQIGHCQTLSFLSPFQLKNFEGRDLSPQSRATKETADWMWERMRKGEWPLSSKFTAPDKPPPGHSDGIVAVDRWGNVATVTHSINTNIWGTTGLFVDGISIPDSAAIQQTAVKRAGPGNRLPDPMCPLIVLREGKPVLGSSAIGSGLHPLTVQVLANMLEFGLDAQSAANAPAFLLPDFAAVKPIDRVEKGQFDQKLIDAVVAMGQAVKVQPLSEALSGRGYWIGVQIDAKTGRLTAAATKQLPSVAVGY